MSVESFNPVLGFLVPATVEVLEATLLVSSFQSRAGFSGSCDQWQPSHSDEPPHVSIPCWVFWFLRPGAVDSSLTDYSFNPVLGFLVPATVSVVSTLSSRNSFNPVLGFLVPATVCPSPTFSFVYSFQSRAGFSGSCDEPTGGRSRQRRRVSIPCWVFWFLRLAASPKSSRINRFNPVLGFLVPATRPGSPRPPRRRVSIPCWVFWFLRRTCR